jgi:hypothetical protein
MFAAIHIFPRLSDLWFIWLLLAYSVYKIRKWAAQNPENAIKCGKFAVGSLVRILRSF